MVNEYLALREAQMLDENMRGANRGELDLNRRIEQNMKTFNIASLVAQGLVRAGYADALLSPETRYAIQAEAEGTNLTINVDATDGRSFHYAGKNLHGGTHNVRAQGPGSVLLDPHTWMNAPRPTPP
jgi:hypothetical protein